MKTSCGVVLLNEFDEVLLAHATEQSHWDIPKGGPEPQESDLQAALRELREETGVVLSSQELQELGEFSYRRDKKLSLFLARVVKSRIDPAQCVCTSYFADHRDEQVPEVDAFAWVAWADLSKFCTPRMCGVLETTRAQFDRRD